MLKQETKNTISNFFEKNLGITYDDLINMDPDEVQELITKYRMNNSQKPKKYYRVMIGSGEHAIIVKVKKGQKIMTSYGTVIEAGLTREERQQRLNDRIDNMYKPSSFKKRFIRKK